MNSKRLFLLIILLNFLGMALIVILRSTPRASTPAGSDSAAEPTADRRAVRLEIPARPVIEVFDKSSPKQFEIATLRTLAFDLAENAVRQLPANPEALCLLGKLHLRSGNPTAARYLWDYALALDPKFAEAYVDYGHYELNLGSFDKAAENFHRAIQLDSSLIEAYKSLAEAQLSKRDYDQAVKNFEIFLDKNPNSASVWCQLGQAYQQLDKTAETIASYNHALAIEPLSNSAVQGLVTAYRSAGDAESARKYAELAAELVTKVPRVTEDRAAVDPDLVKAQEVFDFVSRSATGVLVRAQRIPLAISQLEKAKALLPKSQSIRGLLIDLYVDQKSVDHAISLLSEQCDQTPGDVNAWLRLGVQGIRFRRFDTAEAALRKAIDLEPENADGHALLSQVQMPPERNPRGAVESARRALQLAPTAGNHYILGTALYHTGDFAGSKEEILKAVELEPRNSEFRAALERL